MGRYRPRHYGQLGRGTPVPGRTRGSVDCGPASWRMMVDALTKGKRRPGIKMLRKRAGTPGPQTTNIWDAQKAIQSFPGLKYEIVRSIKRTKAVMDKGGRMHVCIDYGMFNKLAAKTGDPNFSGGHSVDIMEQRRRNGSVWWLLYDPVDDRRRSTIPQGPRWVKRSVIVKSMEAFGGGKGKCFAGRGYGRMR